MLGMHRAELIATYAEGPARVASALEGITDAELDQPSGSGGVVGTRDRAPPG